MKKKYVSNELLKKIKQITITTKRLLRGSMVGDSRSAIKGTGFEFDQIREYAAGDDVRFIDWNASCRMNKLLIKQYTEERTRTILLAVDVSASGSFGSGTTLKRDILAQAASVLSIVSTVGKDRVGLILFSEEVELYIPPSRGQHHLFTIMRELFEYKAKQKTTCITAALKKLAQYKQRDAVCFLISDFIDSTGIDSKLLSFIAQKHSLYAIRCLDVQETTLGSFGFLPIQDSETGAQLTLDLRGKQGATLRSFMKTRITEQNRLFKKHGVPILDITNNREWVAGLVRFFRRRMSY